MQKFYARFRSSVRPSAVPFQYHLYKGGASVYIKKNYGTPFLVLEKGLPDSLFLMVIFFLMGIRKLFFPFYCTISLFFPNIYDVNVSHWKRNNSKISHFKACISLIYYSVFFFPSSSSSSLSLFQLIYAYHNCNFLLVILMFSWRTFFDSLFSQGIPPPRTTPPLLRKINRWLQLSSLSQRLFRMHFIFE